MEGDSAEVEATTNDVAVVDANCYVEILLPPVVALLLFAVAFGSGAALLLPMQWPWPVVSCAAGIVVVVVAAAAGRFEFAVRSALGR